MLKHAPRHFFFLHTSSNIPRLQRRNTIHPTELLKVPSLIPAKLPMDYFPSPPEVSIKSVLQTFKDISAHGDFALIQQNTAWDEFVNGVDGESPKRTDIINQIKLARQNNLEYVFVIDALNGLNRRDFEGLPAGWDANFANPKVRTAYKNYALWVVRNFHPVLSGSRLLFLKKYLRPTEINTYMDAHPDDAKLHQPLQ